MSPPLKFTHKYQFPIMFGSLLIGAYVAFSNRYYLLGDLEASREILFKEDKEGRALLEAAIREAQKS